MEVLWDGYAQKRPLNPTPTLIPDTDQRFKLAESRDAIHGEGLVANPE
jgi:hypothetical protein